MSLSLALGIVAVVNLALGYALALVEEKRDREACDDQSLVTAKAMTSEFADDNPLVRHDIPIASVPIDEPAPVPAVTSESCEAEPPSASPPVRTQESRPPRAAESSEPRAVLVEAAEIEAAILRWWENDPERTRPICVGQIEIDNLRQLTAEHGATVVSGLGREIERQVLCRLRRDDLVASLGRSRFLVMFPNIDADPAADLLEQLRSEVNAAEFSAEDRTVRTTLTCAVAQAAGADSVETLLAQAAGALREASAAGRNRVAVHDGHALSLRG